MSALEEVCKHLSALAQDQRCADRDTQRKLDSLAEVLKIQTGEISIVFDAINTVENIILQVAGRQTERDTGQGLDKPAKTVELQDNGIYTLQARLEEVKRTVQRIERSVDHINTRLSPPGCDPADTPIRR